MNPQPWTTLTLVLNAVAAALETTVPNLPTQATEKAQEALNTSTNDLYEILVLKGYSPSQIFMWDYGAAYNLDLALYWFAMRSGMLANYDQTRLESLDRREDLQKASAIVINGQAVAPNVNAGPVGGVSSGQLTAVQRAMDRYRGCGQGGYNGANGGGRFF